MKPDNNCRGNLSRNLQQLFPSGFTCSDHLGGGLKLAKHRHQRLSKHIMLMFKPEGVGSKNYGVNLLSHLVRGRFRCPVDEPQAGHEGRSSGV